MAGPAASIDPPLAGTWFGDTGDYIGMQVDIAVRKVSEVYDPSEG